MKGLEMFPSPLVTKFQAAVVAKPGQALLYYIASFAKAAAVRTATRRQQADDHHPHQHLDDVGETITAIALHRLRLLATLAFAIRQHRHLFEHWLDHLLVPLVGRPDANQQWKAAGVTNDVPLAARLGAVRRIRAGVRPPFKARTEALSMMTVRVSNWPCLPSSANTLRCTLSKTPAALHSWSRRQQVVGLTPNSLGNIFQAMPPFNTYKMPSRQLRSFRRGAPPFGEGGCFGNKGLMVSQSSSERRVDMIEPSLIPQSVNLHNSTSLRL